MNIQLEAEYAILIPVLMTFLYGLTQAGVPKKLIPLSAILGGIVIGLFIKQGDMIQGLILGISLAVSTIGTHSTIKNSFQNFRSK